MWWLVALLMLAWLMTLLWGLQARRTAPPVPSPPSDPPSATPLPPVLLDRLGAALAEGLLIFAPDRRVTFANDAVGHILELTPDQLIGQTLITVLRDYYVEALIERAVDSGEQQTTNFQPILSQRRLMLTCQPLAEPVGGGIVVIRDLTQVAQLERARREMVANVSHELRTPLASVRLLVETLASDPPPAIAQRMIGQIGDETEAMTQLVDELRELAQIESGRLALQVQAADLAAVITRTVQRLQPQAQRRELTIRTALPPDLPLVLIDEDRIGQVLLNLLHNALKFTPAGGTITVAAASATPALNRRTAQELAEVDGPHWVVVQVTDTGIGIPAVEIERVFERFYKVDRARTRNSGGTGLGLAIAKHLVDRHGGRIWVEAREGHGSTFSFLLPVA